MNLFKKKNYIILDRRAESPQAQTPDRDAPAVPDGMWVKCSHCKSAAEKRLNRWRCQRHLSNWHHSHCPCRDGWKFYDGFHGFRCGRKDHPCH